MLAQGTSITKARKIKGRQADPINYKLEFNKTKGPVDLVTRAKKKIDCAEKNSQGGNV